MILSQNVLRGARISEIPYLRIVLLLIQISACATSVGIVIWLGSDSWMWFAAAGVPIGLIQDQYRSMLFGHQFPVASMISDITWLTFVVISLLIGLALYSVDSPNFIVGASTIGCCVAVVVAVLAANAPSGRSLYSVEFVPLGPLVFESLLVFGMAQVAQYVCAIVVNVSAVGEYRSALLLLTPITFVSSFAQAVFYPRLDIDDKNRVLGIGACVSGVCLIFGLLGIGLSSWDPLSLFSRFGFNATGSFVATATILSLALSLGAGLGVILLRLRVLWRPRRWLKIRAFASLWDPAIGVPSAIALGAPGIALGPLANNVGTALQVLFVRLVDRTDHGSEIVR
ncbi:hypothetical protein VZC37_13460 [Gordonia sp. LSe1-13]|uniref:Uncharacterized protein n=1 Tax=Gordonia sesuvii TaxID=3116777 RepID=A0ABU7ME78_9ACTN|nr:hypothetical protein [Gordonia sp. LSe1-13]